MDWEKDVSEKARETMKFIGGFGPTVNAQNREVKGYMMVDDGGYSVYIDSSRLREIAAGCNEVADWLDRRAECEGKGGLHVL